MVIAPAVAAALIGLLGTGATTGLKLGFDAKKKKQELAATPQATLGEDKSRIARASVVDSFPWKDIKPREIPTAGEVEQLASPVYT